MTISTLYQMTFTFVCPVPCNHLIRIDAIGVDAAVRKIIEAGGIAYRNDLLTERQLRDLIRFDMEKEDPSVDETGSRNDA
jgi:hypothetical protein